MVWSTRTGATCILTIAKEALGKGKVEMARFAAASAARLADEDSAERERARVYEGAALIVTEDFERGVEMLGAVERSKLAEADAGLLDSALAIAEQVRRLPEDAASESEPPAPPGPAVEGAGQVLQQARNTIAQVDAMLAEAGR